MSQSGQGFDVVTSRAVAPMDRLARWSLPLVRAGGLFLAMKGSSAPEELGRRPPELRRLGGVDPMVETVGSAWLAAGHSGPDRRTGGTG